MKPVVLRGSADNGPKLSGEPGAFYNVLKWALPQLGWSVEHDDPSRWRLAVRNSPAAGSGYYLQIIDDDADHGGDARYAALKGFSSMSDVDTGTDGFPSFTNYWCKSDEPDATPRDWWVIGTDTFFYFVGEIDGLCHIYWAGDILPLHANELFPFMLYTNNNPSTNSANRVQTRYLISSGDDIPNGAGQELARTFDGLTVGASALTFSASPEPRRSGDLFTPGLDGAIADPYSGGIPVSRVTVAQLDSPAWYRGTVPGLLAPLLNMSVQAQSDFRTGDSIGPIFNGRTTVDATFFSWMYALNYRFESWVGAFIIDTESDWSDW